MTQKGDISFAIFTAWRLFLRLFVRLFSTKARMRFEKGRYCIHTWLSKGDGGKMRMYSLERSYWNADDWWHESQKGDISFAIFTAWKLFLRLFVRLFWTKGIMVLYMSFDRFLLAVESRDLSQADKVYYKSVFFFNFTKLQCLNDKIYSYTKQSHLAILQNFWSILSFKNW